MVYVTSDLHGCPITKFKKLLEKANFGDDDYCYVLGDVIDRGPESIELLKWMMQQQNIELIMGNHEAMFLSCSFMFDIITDESLKEFKEDNMTAFNTWVYNGGRETLKELSKCNRETVLRILDYLREAPLFDFAHVNHRDFLLVHSGLGKFDIDKNIENYSTDELLCTRPKITQKYYDNTFTIFGHTPTHFYGAEHQGKALKTSTWIDIDTGAACGGSPMLLRLNDLKEYYL